MRSIFEYLDYRDLLKDAYDERKASDPAYSYRLFAEALGLYASNVFRVLQKETHLPARCQSRAVEYLGLNERAAAYFLLLVAYARERNVSARHALLEKALALRDVHRMELGDKELAYLRDWWIATVRGVLEMLDGRANPAEIASKLVPSVSESEVAAALELLKELGLVRKGSSGRLLVSEAHLGATSGEGKVLAVRHHQRQLLALAADALERIPPTHRDVTTMTMAIDEEVFLRIREQLQECRNQIRKSSDSAKHPDRVMQLVMAYFPTTRLEGRR